MGDAIPSERARATPSRAARISACSTDCTSLTDFAISATKPPSASLATTPTAPLPEVGSNAPSKLSLRWPDGSSPKKRNISKRIV
ncbi:unnamed protein product, partial [Prunus brigantina]